MRAKLLEPLVGEPLALDLVNTRPRSAAGTVDLIADPPLLREWLVRQRDRIREVGRDEPVDDDDVAAVHAIRDHAATAIRSVRAGRPPPADRLEALTEAQRAAPLHRRLRWQDGRVTAVDRRDGSRSQRLASELASAVTDLLCDPAALDAVRECAADDCVMLFLARHPRRRWCDSTRCGNRARVARYYSRHSN